MTVDVGRTLERIAVWLLTVTLLAGVTAAPAQAAPNGTPRPITIGTVPPVAGFPVVLDGVTSITDAQGKARFSTAEEKLADHIELNKALLIIGGRQVEVSVSRVYYAADGDAARLALDLVYPVHFEFASMTGSAVDASIIDTITVKSITGEVRELPAHEESWLQGSRVVPLSGGLLMKELQWTVQRVDYSGSNVVNASQQRFLPAQQEEIDVNLLFYRIDVSVQDAFFGFSHSGTVELLYPDGRSERFSLDEDGRLTLPSLPRGNYTLTTMGAGPDLARPLSLSRDQDLNLSLYSWLDLAIVGAVALLLAVGLPLLGWRRRRSHAGQSPRETGSETDGAETVPEPESERAPVAAAARTAAVPEPRS
jgi:hypothetical protein